MVSGAVGRRCRCPRSGISVGGKGLSYSQFSRFTGRIPVPGRVAATFAGANRLSCRSADPDKTPGATMEQPQAGPKGGGQPGNGIQWTRSPPSRGNGGVKGIGPQRLIPPRRNKPFSPSSSDPPVSRHPGIRAADIRDPPPASTITKTHPRTQQQTPITTHPAD